MFSYLKQSTASQIRSIGPFIDDTDFKTVENGLTINNTNVLLKKNGGAEAAKNSGGATASGSNGMYHLTFDATDTNTVGELAGSVLVSGALVVVFKFWVLEEAIYDALFGASAAGFDSNQRVDVGSWLGTAVTLGSGAPDVNVASIDDIDLSATMKASVNTEVVDTLGTDTIAELTGLPGATPTIKDALMLLYMALRNKTTTTSSEYGVFDDAGTKVVKSTLTDDGSTFTNAKMVAGP